MYSVFCLPGSILSTSLILTCLILAQPCVVGTTAHLHFKNRDTYVKFQHL